MLKSLVFFFRKKMQVLLINRFQDISLIIEKNGKSFHQFKQRRCRKCLTIGLFDMNTKAVLTSIYAVHVAHAVFLVLLKNDKGRECVK